ncbi:hypothetical protein PUN28_000106 [Cardiocondyla obscurior]|uniref:Uncharacterized protein n=1 Tax=Cardiocondyla obscurior TaxID=286306 RepID=A0AAW2GY61_9HYME
MRVNSTRVVITFRNMYKNNEDLFFFFTERNIDVSSLTRASHKYLPRSKSQIRSANKSAGKFLPFELNPPSFRAACVVTVIFCASRLPRWKREIKRNVEKESRMPSGLSKDFTRQSLHRETNIRATRTANVAFYGLTVTRRMRAATDGNSIHLRISRGIRDDVDCHRSEISMRNRFAVITSLLFGHPLDDTITVRDLLS